ncbi:hypothetical protein [Chiayiivirga flava]|uniref:Uncharacterized protein n=1 Tax=Chiayiivirga flava TaxID=659595 RepID=A0A7W8D7J3_9GAMM|nr:hypothetical protein [Chiayiivirga flava]MBB5209335.1 hypothetical protein [Chiayiivirga flava]
MKNILPLVVILFSTCTQAYEVDTHAMVTSEAFGRSTLPSDELHRRLGLDRFAEDAPSAKPFESPVPTSYGGLVNGYLDIENADWAGSFSGSYARGLMEYERDKMHSPPGDVFRKNEKSEYRLRAWLMRGAIREDDLPPGNYRKLPVPDADPHGDLTRVYHHFFNPLNNAGLQPIVLCNFLPDNIGKCVPSTDWAFGTYGISGPNTIEDTSRRNHFTWADAREALWCALTRNAGDPSAAAFAGDNAAERRLCWATTIHSLGHVIHLLQDTAQPQHVRNDPHNPYPEGILHFAGTTLDRRMYEVWTNFRLTTEVSLDAEDEVAQFRAFFKNSNVDATRINTGLNYPIPRFSEPQYYFTTRQVETATTPASLKKRRGLADLTNRSLFSEGTILDSNFPLPPPDPTSPDYTTQDRFINHFQEYGDLIERHLAIPLTDPLKGAYTDTSLAAFDNQLPLATVSMWKDYGWAGAGVIGLDEYSAHADVLIPRAIAYSAGLIDYFFRGKLEITPPLDGLFSVIDHGTPHTVNSKGYPFRSDDGKLFGFTKLRLRVRNATAVVNESGTNLPIPREMLSTAASAKPLEGDPTLVAVARYHRNPCYKPDLSGERRIAFDGAVTEPVGCGLAGTRTPFQELSVSKPVASSAAALNGAGQDLVFDFGAQPIPVNATDLAIQVVYRGPLGLETDAIAVGTFDVREPTYLTHWNNSDYAACNGGWFANGSTPPGCIVEGFGAQRAILTTRVCVGSQMVFEHLENAHGSLGTGQFVRLAALLDGDETATRSRSIVHNLNDAQIRNRSIVGHLRQSDKEQATAQAPFVSEPFFAKRGMVGSVRPLPFYQINGTDPQPANDAGPLDVGALINPLAVAPAPDPGTVLFPDVAVSSMACTTANAKAMFADEVVHAAAIR